MPGDASRQNGRKGGRPKGRISKSTMDKLMAREFVRQRVTDALEELIAAQVSNAKGINYLVVRQKSTGKFKRRVGATDVNTHDPDTEIVEIWEKDPSVQAFTDLLNRALDKPAEQQQTIDLKAEVVMRWQS